MENKFQSPLSTSILYLASRLMGSPLFNGVNELIRLFLFRYFCPFLERALRVRSPGLNFRLIPRHSIGEVGGFTLFLSDLDFTIVCLDDYTALNFKIILDRYIRYSTIFKLIGEVEIYTKDEWEIREEITRKRGQIIELIWNLRKWSWQKKILDHQSSRYHKLKATRSIQKIQLKLQLKHNLSLDNSLELNQLERPIVDHLLRIADIKIPQYHESANELGSGYSSYLGWNLIDVSTLFLALLPDGFHISPQKKEAISNFRKQKGVKDALCTLAIFDLLLIKSRERVYRIKTDEAWFNLLIETITNDGQEFKKALTILSHAT